MSTVWPHDDNHVRCHQVVSIVSCHSLITLSVWQWQSTQASFLPKTTVRVSTMTVLLSSVTYSLFKWRGRSVPPWTSRPHPFPVSNTRPRPSWSADCFPIRKSGRSNRFCLSSPASCRLKLKTWKNISDCVVMRKLSCRRNMHHVEGRTLQLGV